jgi:hypothetical protein
MTTKHEHWRIKILDWGGDAWRWHYMGKHPAKFPSRPCAMHEIRSLRKMELVADAETEAVKIPAGASEPDQYLGNIEH